MTYKRAAIIAIAVTAVGALGIGLLAMGGGSDHPGGTCGSLSSNPPPAPEDGEADSTG